LGALPRRMAMCRISTSMSTSRTSMPTPMTMPIRTMVLLPAVVSNNSPKTNGAFVLLNLF